MQGRYGQGKGQEFVQKFMVEYRLSSGGEGDQEEEGEAEEEEWRVYSDRSGRQASRTNKPKKNHLWEMARQQINIY